MIIRNGHIKYVYRTGNGIDANDNPTAGTVAYSADIPCQYRPLIHDNTSRVDSEHYIRYSFEILVETSEVTPSESISLYDAKNVQTGEFAVISAENMQAVGLTKIIV